MNPTRHDSYRIIWYTRPDSLWSIAATKTDDIVQRIDAFLPNCLSMLTTIDPRGTRFFFFFFLHHYGHLLFSFPPFSLPSIRGKIPRFINGRREIGWWLREKLMESCTNDNPLLMSSVHPTELIDSDDKTEWFELLRSIDLIGRSGGAVIN